MLANSYQTFFCVLTTLRSDLLLPRDFLAKVHHCLHLLQGGRSARPLMYCKVEAAEEKCVGRSEYHLSTTAIDLPRYGSSHSRYPPQPASQLSRQKVFKNFPPVRNRSCIDSPLDYGLFDQLRPLRETEAVDPDA